jgi:hypothetical protein
MAEDFKAGDKVLWSYHTYYENRAYSATLPAIITEIHNHRNYDGTDARLLTITPFTAPGNERVMHSPAFSTDLMRPTEEQLQRLSKDFDRLVPRAERSIAIRERQPSVTEPLLGLQHGDRVLIRHAENLQPALILSSYADSSAFARYEAVVVNQGRFELHAVAARQLLRPTQEQLRDYSWEFSAIESFERHMHVKAQSRTQSSYGMGY